uniref:NADH dehydrogenase [ubiquinone] flavoprotein 3, mitochondrial n=1 Tax=Rhabditophanes sp. KR3021 TaxID=114890 RepID=A0AC35UDR6_9BILA
MLSLKSTILPSINFGVRAASTGTTKFSAAPATTTGIEHANKFKAIGKGHQQDFKDYKCIEYLNFNKWSFYDKDVDMASFRVQQPTNKKPDVLPKTNA